jgi:hypothetical protein
MKDSKNRGGATPSRFEREVAQLIRNGVSKTRAELIVQGRAEDSLRQGWGMGPAINRRSEGNKTGGGGRPANSVIKKSSVTKKKGKK